MSRSHLLVKTASTLRQSCDGPFGARDAFGAGSWREFLSTSAPAERAGGLGIGVSVAAGGSSTPPISPLAAIESDHPEAACAAADARASQDRALHILATMDADDREFAVFRAEGVKFDACCLRRARRLRAELRSKF
jgi:hypothetical protein